MSPTFCLGHWAFQRLYKALDAWNLQVLGQSRDFGGSIGKYAHYQLDLAKNCHQSKLKAQYIKAHISPEASNLV